MLVGGGLIRWVLLSATTTCFAKGCRRVCFKWLIGLGFSGRFDKSRKAVRKSPPVHYLSLRFLVVTMDLSTNSIKVSGIRFSRPPKPRSGPTKVPRCIVLSKPNNKESRYRYLRDEGMVDA